MFSCFHHCPAQTDNSIFFGLKPWQAICNHSSNASFILIKLLCVSFYSHQEVIGAAFNKPIGVTFDYLSH